MKTMYDVVVIGAGSGGLTAAVGFVKVGKSVLLVEREHLGGECTNSGCVPSKALLHHAKAYHQALTVAGHTPQGEEYRQRAFTYVREKVNAILAHETPADFEKLGITVVMGEAEFTTPHTITVADKTYQYKTAIIATGSNPRLVDIPGLDPARTLTNQNIFALESIPERTLIIGAGPIGLEMGQALAMLGSKVTIAAIDTEFGRLEDPAIRPILRQKFDSLGVTIELQAYIQKVENGVAVFDRKDGDTISETFSVPFDKILVAIGRIPNLPRGLDLAGIKSTPHGITVNRHWRTANRHVFALGDVSARLKFTHVADDAARQVVVYALSRGLLPVREKSVPKVTFTVPEIAQVGVSWSEAITIHGADNLHRIEVPFSANDRAHTDDAAAGILVVIAKRISGQVLGAHIAGPAAGELISVFTIAIDQRISLWKLRRMIFAYPTYALVIKKAGDYFFATQLSTLKSDLKRRAISVIPKLVLLGLWLFGLYALYSYQQTFGLTVTELALKLFSFITGTIWGPLLYILIYAIRPLTFIPATPLTLSSGIFFGFWGGLIYTIIGANLSASVAYIVGRYFGNSIKLEETILRPYISALRENPFSAVMTTRLLFFPFDLVNYGAGILKLPFLPYLLATVVGTFLGVATFVSVGAALSVEDVRANGFSVAAIDAQFLILSGIIFVASLGIAKLVKKKAT